MDLSVIIVNYNVKYFLEQCLTSVFRAIKGINSEVIVVDNNSADGSNSMIIEKFRDVKLIRNRHNPGFSIANNQGIKIANGKYILILNPDTVVSEKTFSKCFEFMEEHPDAGAVGVKMIDGKGKYLPESKRALPTPATAFYKMSGLSSLFPGSKRFNRYYLGHLDNDKIQKIEVLTGAFMFIRKEAIEAAGLFDESFFMYGEDIDLSYRILESGFNIYYLPHPSIIHFKGESTRKSEINYVINFYRSMIIFVKKHFSYRRIRFLIWLINLAIFIRGSLSMAKRVTSKLALPVVDSLIMLLVFNSFANLWGNIKFGDGYQYPEVLTNIIIPVYTVLIIATIGIWGGYKTPVRMRSLFLGTLTGILLIMISYAFLPVDLRFSRTIIVFVSLFTLVVIPGIRYILSKPEIIKVSGIRSRVKKIVIASSPEEYEQILEIVRNNYSRINVIGRIAVDNNSDNHSALGEFEQLTEIIRINTPDEIIFSSTDLNTARIIIAMEKLSDFTIDKKIAITGSDLVIGSNSKSRMGEIYTINIPEKKI